MRGAQIVRAVFPAPLRPNGPVWPGPARHGPNQDVSADGRAAGAAASLARSGGVCLTERVVK